MEMNIYAAPLQGYTDRVWRENHAMVYGDGVTAYYSPFMRVEKGDVRRRDLRDIEQSDSPEAFRLVPQIIFRDVDEFSMLADAVADRGYREIDLNMGCPFPLQTGRGRGAALLRRPDVLAEVAKEMERRRDVTFTVKMRLGMEDSGEWTGVVDILNSMPLASIAVHPRTASQGYAGQLHLDSFGNFVESSAHPVVYNGDLLTSADCQRILSDYPSVSGLMIGRGLLARPSLVAEIRSGEEWDRDRRIAAVKSLHSRLFDHAVECYCGDSQILSKLKPFWEYLEPEIGRKVAKAIRKAGSVTRYREAVAAVK